MATEHCTLSRVKPVIRPPGKRKGRTVEVRPVWIWPYIQPFYFAGITAGSGGKKRRGFIGRSFSRSS